MLLRLVCWACGHRVTERGGGTEYACGCGHTFVHHAEGKSLVRHPLRCVLLGHWLSFVETRGAFSEYACRACGHPFLFKRTGAISSPRSTDTAAWRTRRAG